MSTLQAVLSTFLQGLGVPEAELRGAETLARFSLTTTLPAENFAQLSPQALQAFVASFGPALTLILGERDAPILAIEKGVLKDVEKGLGFIRTLKGRLRLELVIEKSLLLQQLGLDGELAKNLYFFFEQNLIKRLKKPPHEFDQELFDAGRLTVIIVSDGEYCVSGSFLYITGENKYLAGKPPIHPPDQGALNRAREYQDIAAENLSWGSFDLKNITPLHFLCRVEGTGYDEMLSAITSRLLLLFILYSANRSNYVGGTYQSFYSSSEQTIELKFIDSPAALPRQELLARFVIWLSRGAESDRLTIFQNAVARELANENPQENFKTFVGQLGVFLADVRWHYRIFIDRQIDNHFDQIEQLMKYVSDVTSDVSASIDSITKGFTDAFLAAVGVVVATLLAALIKNEAQSSIFLFTMRVYAVYLLIFQLLYRLGSILHSYWLTGLGAQERIDEYRARLGRRRVDPLVVPLNRRKTQFNAWFWPTAVLYLLIGVVIWSLAESLPAYLVQSGILPPLPTP